MPSNVSKVISSKKPDNDVIAELKRDLHLYRDVKKHVRERIAKEYSMLMKGDASDNDSDVSSLKTYDEGKGLLITKFHEFVVHEVNDYYIHNYQYKHLLAQKKTSIDVEAALRGDYSLGSDAIKELKGHIVNDYNALMSSLDGGGSPSKMKTVRMLQEKYHKEIPRRYNEDICIEYCELLKQTRSHDDVISDLKVMYKDDQEMNDEYFIQMKAYMPLEVELHGLVQLDVLRQEVKNEYDYALTEREKIMVDGKDSVEGANIMEGIKRRVKTKCMSGIYAQYMNRRSQVYERSLESLDVEVSAIEAGICKDPTKCLHPYLNKWDEISMYGLLGKVEHL